MQNLVDQESAKEQEEKKPSFFRRLWNGVSTVARGVKHTLLWTNEEGDNTVNPERLSQTVFGNYRKEITDRYLAKTGEKQLDVRFWN